MENQQLPELRLSVDKAVNGRFEQILARNPPPDGRGIGRYGRTRLGGTRYEWRVGDTPENRAWAKAIGATKLRA